MINLIYYPIPESSANWNGTGRTWKGGHKQPYLAFFAVAQLSQVSFSISFSKNGWRLTSSFFAYAQGIADALLSKLFQRMTLMLIGWGAVVEPT